MKEQNKQEQNEQQEQGQGQKVAEGEVAEAGVGCPSADSVRDMETWNKDGKNAFCGTCCTWTGTLMSAGMGNCVRNTAADGETFEAHYNREDGRCRHTCEHQYREGRDPCESPGFATQLCYRMNCGR